MKNEAAPSQRAMTIGNLVNALPAEEVNNWPEESKNIAIEMIAKHGFPDVVAPQVLVWIGEKCPIVVEKNLGFLGPSEQV